RVAYRFPAALIPQHDGTAAIFAFRNDAFETAIFQRMVLGADGEPLVGGVGGGAPGDRPALEDAVELEAEIIVQPRGVVLLDDEAQRLRRPAAGPLAGPGGLPRAREVALGPVVPEQFAGGAGHLARLLS